MSRNIYVTVILMRKMLLYKKIFKVNFDMYVLLISSILKLFLEKI